MRSGKGNSNNNNHEDDEYEDDDYASKKDGPSSNTTTTNNSNNTRDGKNSDKASAMRSKHSVTEQRRRSKINERFQILRDLIPHSDQKRDTASFLLEVIEYVQYLQEKMQKYEGSYQGWSSEPTKLMPWRNSHWRVQNFVGHPQPQAIKNGSGSGPVSTFIGKLDENIVSPSMLRSPQNPAELDHSMDVNGKAVDPLPEVVKGVLPVPMPLRACIPTTARSDGVLSQPLQIPVSDAQCPVNCEALNQQEDLAIEGGTISFSSVYSQGLLNTLTQALHSAGIDLSQASVSVQIDLGKRANRGINPGTSTAKEQSNHTRDASSGEESDQAQAQKRLKTINL